MSGSARTAVTKVASFSGGPELEPPNRLMRGIADYIASVGRRFKSGIAREHAYRPDLQLLLEGLLPNLQVTNEPSDVTDAGNPDFVVTRSTSIPVGFIEAKDVDKGLDSRQFKEQFDRYRMGLDNLILTNYLRFEFYRHSELVERIDIGAVVNGKVEGDHSTWDRFELLLKEFGAHVGQSIRSAKKLAVLMADKAKLLQNTLVRALQADLAGERDSDLCQQYQTFQAVLIHDLAPEQFSDLYAQTLAYGLFAARLHDDTLESFTRQEAAELIPQTSPFLRRLFGYVAGADIDRRIERTVDNLADIFLRADVRSIMERVGRRKQMGDAVIHFYETFLAEYNPELRKARGVWYTPLPVVRFIVQAVDDILRDHFGLDSGLADESKVEIRVKNDDFGSKGSAGKTKTIKKRVHRVQILDPATGTGTFLAEVIDRVFESTFKGAEGAWPRYVEDDLLPRLNGFELLMAPYAMAHLKLDLLLSGTGVERKKGDRTRVFLTNSLEEHHPATGTLFASFLSAEANAANAIKRDTPVMCVLGNPPYSGISTNKGEWITGLIDEYKYVDGEHFGERKHWLGDDYVKFIRMGEELIERTGEGILAFINNHSFIDNPTFRGMRQHLLATFDLIYILDLHGNSKKKERSPDGSRDDNVFDIQAGVSINIFVKGPRAPKARRKGKQARVLHFDVYGERVTKYQLLSSGRLASLDFAEVSPSSPFYFFIPRDKDKRSRYEEGIKLSDLMPISVAGIVTARDSVVLGFTSDALVERMERFCDSAYSDDQTRRWLFPNKKDKKYKAGDSRGWQLERARKVIAANKHGEFVRRFDYRPFDSRLIYYSRDMVDWPREEGMRHVLSEGNIALVVPKINKEDLGAFVTRNLAGHKLYSAYDSNSLFPLYVLPPPLIDEAQGGKRQPNFSNEALEQLAAASGLPFSGDQPAVDESMTALDVLDYVYGSLNNPTYVSEFAELLKIDFPRVPLPRSTDEFRRVAQLGRELREVHLLEDDSLRSGPVTFPFSGDNTVTRRHTKASPGFHLAEGSDSTGRVFINDAQYFESVEKEVYEHVIGGYQPAKRWLTDRIGQELSLADVRHYQLLLHAIKKASVLLGELATVRPWTTAPE